MCQAVQALGTQHMGRHPGGGKSQTGPMEEVLVETVTLTSLELDTSLGTDPWDLESTS